MKNFILMLAIITLSACSSSPYEVVESLDGNDRPEWASIAKTSWKSDGYVHAVGIAEGVPADRVTALMRIADNNAKSEITRLMANEIGVDFKNIEAGLRGEGSYSFIGTEKSFVSVQELAITGRHFENFKLKKVEDAPVKTHFYTKVSIPEATYNRLIKEAREKAQNATVEVAKTQAE